MNINANKTRAGFDTPARTVAQGAEGFRAARRGALLRLEGSVHR